jgi:hypothetical protein
MREIIWRKKIRQTNFSPRPRGKEKVYTVTASACLRCSDTASERLRLMMTAETLTECGEVYPTPSRLQIFPL